MKRLAWLLCLPLLALHSLPASGQLSVGLLGGGNLSTFESKADYSTTTRRTGLVIGGVLHVPLTERVGLRFEPLFTQKGGTGVDASVEEETTLSSSFLEVSGMVQVTFGTDTRPYLLFGPTMGVVLASKVEANVSGIPLEGDLMDTTERFELGLGFGGGVSHAFEGFSVFLEGCYVWGLSNMQKGGEVELSSGQIAAQVTFDKEDNEYFHRGLRILAGFTLPWR